MLAGSFSFIPGGRCKGVAGCARRKAAGRPEIGGGAVGWERLAAPPWERNTGRGGASLCHAVGGRGARELTAPPRFSDSRVRR
jgi:hypothetical protein